jgi:hypothetical protein
MWMMVKASLFRRVILLMAISVLLALIAAVPKTSGQGPGTNQSTAGDDATTVRFVPAPDSPFAVGTEPERVASDDFNGDRNPDLAVTNTASNNVTVLLGDGRGGFAPAPGSPFAVGTLPLEITIADFNADRNPDLAVTNLSSNNVTVLLGDGRGGFAPASGSPFAVGAFPLGITSDDFNRDEKPDLATANIASSNVTVLLNTTPTP